MPATIGKLTDRQKAVILVLAERTGVLLTTELRELVARAGGHDDDFPDLRPALNTEQISSTCRQLEQKGLVSSEGYLFTERRWAITDKGKAARDSIRGVI